MDLNQQIEAATNKVIAESLPAMVETKVKKMLDDLLDDMFRSYGDIAKSVKEKIVSQLNVNLQEFSLVDYNTFISKAITNALNDQISKEVLKPIDDLVKNLVNPLKKDSFTLAQIHEKYMKFQMEENSDETEGEFTFIVDDTGSSYITLCIDPKPDQSKHSCESEICISKDNGHVFLLRTMTNWGKKGEVNPVKLTQLDNFQLFLFRLYSTKTPITGLEERHYFENSWSRYN